MISISKIEKNKNNLHIKWSDGEESNFNYFWLRDNCPTAHDKDSNHRMFNILEVSKNLSAKKFRVNEKGKLVIEWSEGNHTSYYDSTWLRENCYTLKSKQKYKSPYQLWNNSLEKNLESISVDHDEILNSEEGLIKWLELLHYKGIAIVKNTPIEKKSAFPCASISIVFVISSYFNYAIITNKNPFFFRSILNTKQHSKVVFTFFTFLFLH